jgi:hypothetical protein
MRKKPRPHKKKMTLLQHHCREKILLSWNRNRVLSKRNSQKSQKELLEIKNMSSQTCRHVPPSPWQPLHKDKPFGGATMRGGPWFRATQQLLDKTPSPHNCWVVDAHSPPHLTPQGILVLC